jgi:hypothetical protein
MPRAWFGEVEMAEREACLSSADPAICERVLLRHDDQLEEQGLVQVPLGSELVRDLTVYALEQGGTGAYERLVDSRGADLRQRLGEAAAADPDGLVLGWMEQVLTRGSSRADRSRRGRSAGLLWYLVFAGFAARSSRWRLD